MDTDGHRAGVIQEVASALMVEESDLPEMQPYNIPKVLAGIKFSFCPSDEVLDSDRETFLDLSVVCGVSPLVILFLSVLVKVLIGVLVDKLYYSPFLERLCATQKSYSFCIACHYGRDTVVRGLLESEVDVNGMATVFDSERTYIGTWTPMTFAANNGHFDIVKMLIDAGADVNARDTDEWTPLHFAARYASSDVVKMLIEAGADVNARTTDGWYGFRDGMRYGFKHENQRVYPNTTFIYF